MSKSVDKNVFKKAYQDFRKKIFNNKMSSYNKGFDKSDEYKKKCNRNKRKRNYKKKQKNVSIRAPATTVTINNQQRFQNMIHFNHLE